MKSKKHDFDISIFNCGINFAFCPSCLLKLSSSSGFKDEIAEDLYRDFPGQNKNDLISATRYFYVCYSLKIEDPQFENQDYFYFQIFSKIAGHLKPHEPTYGFFHKEKVSFLIQEINEMFNPLNHDKVILDSFAENIYSDAGSVISELQKWTELKLIDFNKFYFLNPEVLTFLVKIIDNEKKEKKINKKTTCKSSHEKKQIRKNKRRTIS
jgi:hypothetical protein